MQFQMFQLYILITNYYYYYFFFRLQVIQKEKVKELNLHEVGVPPFIQLCRNDYNLHIFCGQSFTWCFRQEVKYVLM